MVKDNRLWAMGYGKRPIAHRPSPIAFLLHHFYKDYPNLIKNIHRHGKEHQVIDIGRRGYEGGSDDDTEDRISAGAHKHARFDDAQFSQCKKDEGNFKRGPERKYHHRAERDIPVHRYHGFYKGAFITRDEEFHAGREDDEIAENGPAIKEHRCGEYEKPPVGLLHAVQVFQFIPGQKENKGECEEDAREEGKLHTAEKYLLDG